MWRLPTSLLGVCLCFCVCAFVCVCVLCLRLVPPRCLRLPSACLMSCCVCVLFVSVRFWFASRAATLFAAPLGLPDVLLCLCLVACCAFRPLVRVCVFVYASMFVCVLSGRPQLMAPWLCCRLG